MVTAIDIMANCSEDDDIIFHVSSDGGSLDSLDSLLFVQWLAALHTNTLYAQVRWQVQQHSSLLIVTHGKLVHTPFSYSIQPFGSWGKQHDVIMEASFINERCERFMRGTIPSFLLR